MPEDTWKQKRFYENEIAQYLQNYKCYDVGQDNFRKPLQNLKTTQKYLP